LLKSVKEHEVLPYYTSRVLMERKSTFLAINFYSASGTTQRKQRSKCCALVGNKIFTEIVQKFLQDFKTTIPTSGDL